MIHEKNPDQKISCYCPFKNYFCDCKESLKTISLTVKRDLEEGGEGVHEAKHVSVVNKGQVEYSSQHHEHDGVQVLNLKHKGCQ